MNQASDNCVYYLCIKLQGGIIFQTRNVSYKHRELLQYMLDMNQKSHRSFISNVLKFITWDIV